MPPVRAFLLDTQRALAREQSVVMDGRDIATVVLPGADLKIFLTASPEKRAERRWQELRARGSGESYEQVLAETLERDKQDSERAAAPLEGGGGRRGRGHERAHARREHRARMYADSR